jgi:fumarate hydratase class II
MTQDAGEFRIEKDTMGEMRVPKDALYAAQTQRAVENFPISGQPMPPAFVHALGLVKLACATVNGKAGKLDAKAAEAIQQAAREVADGKLDVFQTGSGTSSNMNANEVIASRANQILGEKKVHANDHVNYGQSSNDVIPTAMHVAAVLQIENDLLPALHELHQALDKKSREFDGIVKMGRTHLMDAVPIRLGQEFSGYARQVELGIQRIEGTEFQEAVNHFEAQGAQDAYAFTAGALTTVAASLMKIANDIRLMGSGPQGGLGELLLPAIQPGSSIMPGKVNPVICEMMVQVGAQVTGNCHAVTIGAQWGQLDLNVMLPMMTRNLLESVRLTANASRVFKVKLLDGLKANKERAEGYVEKSISMATALNPYIGYEKAAAIAKESYQTGRTVREIAYEKSGLTKQQVDEALEPRKQTVPGGEGSAGG